MLSRVSKQKKDLVGQKKKKKQKSEGKNRTREHLNDKFSGIYKKRSHELVTVLSCHDKRIVLNLGSLPRLRLAVHSPLKVKTLVNVRVW